MAKIEPVHIPSEDVFSALFEQQNTMLEKKAKLKQKLRFKKNYLQKHGSTIIYFHSIVLIWCFNYVSA